MTKSTSRQLIIWMKKSLEKIIKLNYWVLIRKKWKLMYKFLVKNMKEHNQITLFSNHSSKMRLRKRTSTNNFWISMWHKDKRQLILFKDLEVLLAINLNKLKNKTKNIRLNFNSWKSNFRLKVFNLLPMRKELRNLLKCSMIRTRTVCN